VGYLSREVAAEFASTLDRLGGSFPLDAKIHGGTVDKPNIGVTLDFEPIYEIAPLLKKMGS
jgi:hypothetical protein